MGLKTMKPTQADVAFRKDLLALLQKHNADNSGERLLALASYVVGQLITLQDRRKFTQETVIELVKENIEAGNADAVSCLLDKTAGSA